MAASEMRQGKACRLEPFRKEVDKANVPPGVKDKRAGHSRATSESRDRPGGRV